MTLEELEDRNRHARDLPASRSFETCMTEGHYQGFVDVRVDGSPSFVMFSNDDEVVAKAYLFKGANAFEGQSLRIWASLAKTHRVIFDVGAFTGVYALAAASANPEARVLAFEPAANTYHRLLTNVLANQLGARIGCLQSALGAKAQTLALHHPDGIYVLGSGESLIPTVLPRIFYSEPVNVMVGDRLAKSYRRNPRPFLIETDPSRVSLMKIDVEGFELQVLRGFKRLLRANLPSMIVECLGKEPFERVARFLSPMGYHSRFIDDLTGDLHVDLLRFERQPANVLFWVNDPVAQALAGEKT